VASGKPGKQLGLGQADIDRRGVIEGSVMRRGSAVKRFWVLSVVVLTVLRPLVAQAACNLIPQTENIFDAARGASTRPFAAPGEPLEVHLRPCEAPTPAIGNNAGDQVVTVIFTPKTGGARAAVLTTAADCSALPMSACQTALGGNMPKCVAGANAAMQVVQRNGTNYLRFNFPDTDDLVGATGDGHTLAGPAKIVVTQAPPATLGCQLATSTCASQLGTINGLVACIDDFFANDGACGHGAPRGTFDSFTALPPPNDFAGNCWSSACNLIPNAEFRATTDKDGNILLPMDWRGILVRHSQVPVPRLLRATLDPSIPFRVPGVSFVASFTPEGGPLPPIFEPESDPQAPSGVVTLFGSADAPYTVLRVARRSETFQQCAGGGNDGLPCNDADDCPGACVAGTNMGKACHQDADCPPSSTCGPVGTCGATVCFGGTRDGLACNSDGTCPGGGECGPGLIDLRTFGTAGGAGDVVVAQIPGPLHRGVAGDHQREHRAGPEQQQYTPDDRCG
jgi:hypothetical protein